ncbi:MAG TPA: AAA family ATPase [Acidimicrobiales bacterium]|nr:AAA family ATPase [Acidimicrobiales bacterium]
MLDIHLLNEQRIGGGPEVPGRAFSSRSLALLAYLVLHAEAPQPRQHLAAVFWPDSSEAQARTNLRRELHHLRSLLGEEPSLRVESSALSWHDCPSCRVDVRVFEQEWARACASRAAGDDEGFLAHAESAIAEYRGELLPGSYEEWVLEGRRPLLRKCVDLCDGVVRLHTEAGNLARAIDVAHRRVQLAPLEEMGYRTLMALQAESGDRAAAVSTYHRCADVLERELGVTPDAETIAFVDRLLDRRTGVAASGSLLSARPGPQTATTSGFVGRDRELELVVGAWRAAVDGASGLLVVSGEPGVGKSRLVGELAALASAEGAAVAATRCFGQSRRLALAPVAEWLRSPALEPAVAALDAVWRGEVARLVPSAGSRGDPVEPLDRLDVVREGLPATAWQQHRFFEGLVRAVLGAGRPTLLVLDDLQWCDQETVAWLVFALGLAKEAPLLIAATARRDDLEENREVATTLRGLRSAGLVQEVELSPLDAGSTSALAGAVLGRDLASDEDELLQAATGGYPLFVVEAARSLRETADSWDPTPAADLQSVLRQRLAQASPEAREVAGLAAAIGRDFRLDVLSQAAEVDNDTLVQAVDELWRLRILRERRSSYDFSHDLLREVAYAEISPARRWLLHRRIAQSLEAVHADNVDVVAVQLAEQYDRGGQEGRAFLYYRKAAALAESLFAHAEAVRLHQRSLELLERLPGGRDRDALELEVLQAMSAPLNAVDGYSSPRMQSQVERIALLAEGLGQTSVLVRSLVGLFGVYFVQGKVGLAYEVAKRSLALAGDVPELAAQAHFAVAGTSLSLGMLASAAAHFDLVLEPSAETVSLMIGTRLDVHSQGWAAHAHWLLGDEHEAVCRSDDALRRARAAVHPYSLAVALGYQAITDQLRGDMASLPSTTAELRELCQRNEFAYYGEWGLILGGWAEGGEAGLDHIRLGIRQLRSHGAYARMPYWLSLLSVVLEGLGRTEEAIAALDGAVAAAEQRDDQWWLPEVLRLRAAISSGPAAGGLLDRALDLARAHGSRTIEARCLADQAARRSASTGKVPS